MKLNILKRISLLLLLVISLKAHADSDKPIPFDPQVIHGQLENGLHYYIRQNHKPNDRAELRLVVHAGSIQEDDDQQGLAHFVEHMAFNGTKHFKKQELIRYLESIGMKFGADANAYTSFDETVYMLTIPTDKKDILEKGMQILEDWAHSISFDQEEINKERPVIVEEWRTGRGATARMRDQQWPILLQGSKYANRMPIGKMEVINSFKRDTLVRFYKDWYRPDLMAIIAVGDFDPPAMEKRIRDHFSNLTAPKPLRTRENYPVPPHEETRFAIATDPETPRNSAQIIYKSDLELIQTYADARRTEVENLFFAMLNERLAERSREADPPYLGAYSGLRRFVGRTQALAFTTIIAENGVEKGLSAVLEEARRAELYGFTEPELVRTKADLLRNEENLYENRDKTESSEYAANLIQSFLYNEPMSSVDWDYDYIKTALPDIHLAEINDLSHSGLSGKNRVVLVNAPQKEGISVPSEASLAALLETAKSADVKPYQEDVPQEPLVKEPPHAATIVSESKVAEMDITDWKLSNGVRVILKPTDFKNDEIQFSAWSPGGSSLEPDSDATSANYADDLADISGAGAFDEIQLAKVLAGKIASVSPYIGFYYEGMQGNSAPRDLETALQLVYLEFTAPRMDDKAFASFLSKQTAALQNRNLQPETRFRDELSRVISQDNIRTRPPSVDLLKELNEERAFQIYKDRFADASDFTFEFVGNFDVAKVKPLILTYLGGLPDLERHETWKDLKILPPDGVVQKEYRFGSEPKAAVNIYFHGPFEWNIENRLYLRAMCDYLNRRLRKSLREDMGGVYGVSVSQSATHVPEQRYQITIRFGCAPDRVKELVSQVFYEIESLKQNGADPEDVMNVRQAMLRQHEVDLKDNGYWLWILESSAIDGEDVRDVLHFEDRLKKVSPNMIQHAAKMYLSTDSYIKAILLPEK